MQNISQPSNAKISTAVQANSIVVQVHTISIDNHIYRLCSVSFLEWNYSDLDKGYVMCMSHYKQNVHHTITNRFLLSHKFYRKFSNDILNSYQHQIILLLFFYCTYSFIFSHASYRNYKIKRCLLWFSLEHYY